MAVPAKIFEDAYKHVTGKRCTNSETDRRMRDPDFLPYMDHATWTCYVPTRTQAEDLEDDMMNYVISNWYYYSSVPSSNVKMQKTGHWAGMYMVRFFINPTFAGDDFL